MARGIWKGPFIDPSLLKKVEKQKISSEIEKNTKEEEKNINTALLLDPKNEEAMYILIDLELERSNFSKVQDLKKDFKKICNTLCEKLTSIDTRLKDFEKKDAS